jgi:SAM-dependent methyltransferase
LRGLWLISARWRRFEARSAGRALAARYGMSARTRFDVGVAEALDYPSSHVDIVVGIDILHHVEVASAAAECLRVLKPDGIAIFKEPVAVPLFDRFRNSPGLRHSSQGRVVRPAHHGRRAKADASRPAIDSAMWSVEAHRFRLLSRLDALTRVLGGSVVLLCRRPRLA